MVKSGQVTLSQQEIGWTPSANATAGVQIAAAQWRQLVPGINWISPDITGYLQANIIISYNLSIQSVDTIWIGGLEWQLSCTSFFAERLLQKRSWPEWLQLGSKLSCAGHWRWLGGATQTWANCGCCNGQMLGLYFFKHFKTNKQQTRLLFPQSLWYPWPNPR